MTDIPVIDLIATGRNIARLRALAGLTVRDLQDVFGFGTPQAIYKWQRGAALPTVDNLVILAAVFGVAIEDILVVQGAAAVRISA
ncbi:MAG: helix-turn-helix transcriptional regulator [Oscillospiraceae bacterium]|nr:helix-turn-helix transcriptional regulator [Oscillospiraceae bacterium]